MNWNESESAISAHQKSVNCRVAERPVSTLIFTFALLTGSPDLSATLGITGAICPAGNMYLNPLKACMCREGSRSWLPTTLLPQIPRFRKLLMDGRYYRRYVANSLITSTFIPIETHGAFKSK